MNYPQALTKLIDRHDLPFAEMRELMQHIMGGQLAPAQIAAILIALRMKVAFTADDTPFQSSYNYAVDVLPYAALVMLLLFSGDGLYRQRHLRPGSAQIMGSLFKVAVVTLAFAVIEGARFQSYYIFWGTFIVASLLIVCTRVSYDVLT